MAHLKILCSPCWDKSGALYVRGIYPRTVCEACGELHMGYGAEMLEEPQAPIAVDPVGERGQKGTPRV